MDFTLLAMGIGVKGSPALTWIIFGVIVLLGVLMVYREKRKKK
jgi:hypothetical protein